MVNFVLMFLMALFVFSLPLKGSFLTLLSVSTFTKGLGFTDLASHVGTLALFVPALLALSLFLLRKQER